jgi:hypothetical protein
MFPWKILIWLSDTTDDSEKDCERGIGEKWDDFNSNPDEWKKVDEKDDPRPPRDGFSSREKWRNKKTGEEIGIHQKWPTGKTRKGKPKHPHPFPPENF